MIYYGGIAQLARAPALQAGGRRFESDYLHHFGVVQTIPKNLYIGFTYYGNIAQLVRAPP